MPQLVVCTAPFLISEKWGFRCDSENESRTGTLSTRDVSSTGGLYWAWSDCSIQPISMQYRRHTPAYCHLNDVLAIASAGKHILCKKPIARTPNQCDQMIDTYRKHNITLMATFMERDHKCSLKTKQIIDNDELGPVFQGRVNWRFLSPPGRWRDSLPTWGGIYQDYGSHTIDLCRWWLGDCRDRQWRNRYCYEQ